MIIKNNWFSSNFSEVASGKVDQFQVKLNPYPFLDLSFDKAAKWTAYTIQQEFRFLPLYLGLSGGADSEFIARLFRDLDIKFTPIIVKSDNNQEDFIGASGICNALRLHPDIIETTEQEMNHYYLHKVHTRRSEGLMSVNQLMVIDRVARYGGVAILGETHLYDPDPQLSIVRAFKFLPQYYWVIPFYYYTLELTYAEMKEVRPNETAQEFKARVRGTKLRHKIFPNFTPDSTMWSAFEILDPRWLLHDMGTPNDFVQQMKEYAI